MAEENNQYTENNSGFGGRKSIFFPLLLVIVGVVILLSNLNVLPDDSKTMLLRLWPALFIIGGLEDLINRKWVGAVLNVGIGTVLIMANMGYFPWTAWGMIWRIWPVFIIAIGLDIAFKGQSVAGTLIGVTISVLIVAGILWFALNSSLVRQAASMPLQYERGNVEQLKLDITPAVSDLELQGGTASNHVLSGEIYISNREELMDDYSVSGNSATLSMSSEGVVIFPSRTSGNGYPWILNVNEDVALDLNVKQAVGRQNIDLSALDITQFDISLAVGQVIVELPDAENYSGQIDCAVGEIIIYVPRDVPVKFNVGTAITATHYPNDFVREGEWLYSSGAMGAGDATVIEVDLPMGSLDIRLK